METLESDQGLTQKEKVLGHLQRVGYITPKTAMNRYGIYRLGARIFELRQEGWDINTEQLKNRHGNYYAKYQLVTD